MVRTFHQHRLAIALVLSMALALSGGQLAQAKISGGIKQQQPAQNCIIDAFMGDTSIKIMPHRSYRLVANGYISCEKSTGAEEIWIIPELQQFTNGKWVSIGYNSSMMGGVSSLGGVAYASTPCSLSSPTHYRAIVTGRYRNASGWHDIPSHGESDAWISCK